MNHERSNLISSVIHRMNVMTRYGKIDEQLDMMSGDEISILRKVVADISQEFEIRDMEKAGVWKDIPQNYEEL
jgi:hypothetical protein